MGETEGERWYVRGVVAVVADVEVQPLAVGDAEGWERVGEEDLAREAKADTVDGLEVAGDLEDDLWREGSYVGGRSRRRVRCGECICEFLIWDCLLLLLHGL